MLLARSSTCGAWHENSCLRVVHVPRKRNDARGYYELLGVEPDATDEEVRKAGKKLVMETHPDTGGDANNFIAAVEAYQTLSNPAKRAEYDQCTVEPTLSLKSAHTASFTLKLGNEGEPIWYKEPTMVLTGEEEERVRRWHAMLLQAARDFQLTREIKAGICQEPSGYYEEGDIQLIGRGQEPETWAAYTLTLKGFEKWLLT